MHNWEQIDEGSFNTVYINKDNTAVLKIQKNQLELTDSPERSVRIWNEVNSKLAPPAYVLETEFGRGWVCPYVTGTQASDSEISGAVLNIFNETGRIILDAPSPDNFLKTADNQIVCIDIGMAFQMEQRDDEIYNSSARRKSIVSLDTWALYYSEYTKYFQQCLKYYPDTVKIIKALLFIKTNRPDIFNVDFLKNNSKLITKLERAYDNQNASGVLGELNKIKPQALTFKDGLQELEKQRSVHLKNLKESCMHELHKYIFSRGWLNKNDRFFPSIITRLFRNSSLTTEKVTSANHLIYAIKSADSAEAIEALLIGAQSHNEQFTSVFTQSGLATSIGKCLLMVEVAKTYPTPHPVPLPEAAWYTAAAAG